MAFLEFQSAPLTEARGDVAIASNQRHLVVSIRSPHRSKGRLCLASLLSGSYLFQSAPLTEARGDRTRSASVSVSDRFQSAPLTEARGDPDYRGPYRAERRFQSAPLTEARGDPHFPAPTREKIGFNPLPSPKQGETVIGPCLPAVPQVSIRSPHRSKGRPDCFAVDGLSAWVSIRSPHRSKGRPDRRRQFARQ